MTVAVQVLKSKISQIYGVVIGVRPGLGHQNPNEELMPCPFTGPKMFCAGPNFLFRTKNLLTYCASHKHFVPDKKRICIQ